MRRIVLYSAVNALAMVIALGLVSDPAWAQQCRRSCKAGEERDARGCCIPGKAEQQKKEREHKAAQEKQARKERERAAAEKRKKAEAERRRKQQAEKAAREERARRKARAKAEEEASQSTNAGDKSQDGQAQEGTESATTDPVVKSRDPGPGGDGEPVDRKTSDSSSPTELDTSIPGPEAGDGAAQRRWATWMPWSVVGAGAALFVTGGVLEWRAVANGNSYDQAFTALCGSIGCFESESGTLDERLDKAALQQRLGIAFFITGGAAIATGLALVYLNRPTEAAVAGEAAGESSSNVSLVPMISPGATGMTVHIRF